jgi:hypothetical protein
VGAERFRFEEERKMFCQRWTGFLPFVAGVALLGPGLAQAEEEVPLRNWSSPPFWAPAARVVDRVAAPDGAVPRSAGREALALPSGPLPFVAITPCRLADTRNATFPSGYGPPSLQAATSRDFVFTARCGIPSSAQAVSTNLTATNALGAGFILNYPAGGSLPSPPVSSLNYLLGQTVANAAIVPLGTGNAATFIAGVSGTDLIIDVNGYYDGSGLVTSVATGMGLEGGGTGDVTVGITAGGVTSTELAANAVTAPAIAAEAVTSGALAPNAAVKSLNTLVGDVTLSPGSNVSITLSGQTLTIASASSGGTVTSVGTGSGLTGGPITLSGTVSVAPLGITTGMLADLAVTSDKLANGAVGLSQIDTTQVQARVSNTCPAGSMIQSINSDGSVVCTASSPQTGFSLSTLDSAGNVGLFTSITVGSDGVGLISYYDITNGDLKVAHCSNVNCSTATLSTLDSGEFVGGFTSITIGSDGLGLISCFDGTNGDLKVAHCSNGSCSTAATYTLDSVDLAGYYTSITIGSDGLGLISYYDGTNGDLKVAHCSDVNCSAAMTSTLDSAGEVGYFTSITIGSDGLGLISYWDVTNSALKVAHCSNALCTPYVRRR